MLRAILAVMLLASLHPGVARTVHAQESGMSTDIEFALVELGTAINLQETAKLYAPLQEKEPYASVKAERDIKYGADARQSLDVFTPETSSGARPVLMFVHGGGFTAGNKRGPGGSPFYDNIMLFAVRNGMVGVNMTYRLAPQHPWPAGAEDVAAAVRWTRENIAAKGGDPARIFLMGHSAGAAHAASYVAHSRFHAAGDPGLAGAIFLSGIYQIGPGTAQPDYFGTDPTKFAEMTSLPNLAMSKVPILLAATELDPALFVNQANLLDDALCAQKKCGRLITLAKHSHMSEVYAINTRDTVLSDAIVSFIRTGK